MTPCPRHLRLHAENVAKPAHPPTQAKARARERIRAVALSLLAAYGRANLTIGRLALALDMQPGTLRRHIVDLDLLLADLIGEELRRLSSLLAAIPRDTPNRPAACRAAWLAATRRLGAHTEAHTLVVRDLALLQDDLRAPLEQTLGVLAHQLAGPHGAKCLVLFANPCFSAEEIETIVAALPAAATAELVPSVPVTAPAECSPPVKTPIAPRKPPPPADANAHFRIMAETAEPEELALMLARRYPRRSTAPPGA